MELHRFRQFLFSHQWSNLKAYARGRGLRLIGDLPIFVAGDSADVWTNPDLFLLDERRRPAVVAGVPPDYFSTTGQLWGNPLYDWEAHQRTGYAWWTARLRRPGAGGPDPSGPLPRLRGVLGGAGRQPDGGEGPMGQGTGGRSLPRCATRSAACL